MLPLNEVLISIKCNLKVTEMAPNVNVDTSQQEESHYALHPSFSKIFNQNIDSEDTR